ncbi:MAG: mycothiol synthase [Jiangellaceae bacterium]
MRTTTATTDLDDDTRAQISALIARAVETDGVEPVSEQGMLRLRGGAEPTRHLVSRQDRSVAGYAQLDVDSASAEVVVDPSRRQHGIGRTLVDELIVDSGPGLRVWAHGDLPSAAALAASRGFERVRALWQMSRPLAGQLPEPQVPDGVVVDTFTPGVDDADWVRLNAAVFARHPEQGRLTLADLRDRMGLPWFDPAGFLVARRSGHMVGFHWTKVPDVTTGEVYVVGVDAAERGTGLGRALTLVGLHHLRSSGLDTVTLYVDEDNQPAIRLYVALGFTRVAVDVMYAPRPAHARPTQPSPAHDHEGLAVP